MMGRHPYHSSTGVCLFHDYDRVIASALILAMALRHLLPRQSCDSFKTAAKCRRSFNTGW